MTSFKQQLVSQVVISQISNLIKPDSPYVHFLLNYFCKKEIVNECL